MDPYELLAQHPDIAMTRVRLPDGQVGRWYPAHRVIMLDDRLSRAEERCTLLHELMHVLSDDKHIDDHRLSVLQEKRCHEMVARALIPLDRLAAALQWSRDEHELAAELDVDLPTFRARRDSLTRQEREIVNSYLEDEDNMEASA